MKVKIGFTIEPELLHEVDTLRGITKRSTFLQVLHHEHACRQMGKYSRKKKTCNHVYYATRDRLSSSKDHKENPEVYDNTSSRTCIQKELQVQ
ncbi:hypothetical protein KAU92_06005 [Candidatus Bathyarchaeota archaeon]|nr:hypothetical protein [Candidatus Bathyarchaeota archaeon]